jgi:hypothetical protein
VRGAVAIRRLQCQPHESALGQRQPLGGHRGPCDVARQVLARHSKRAAERIRTSMKISVLAGHGRTRGLAPHVSDWINASAAQ